MANTKVVTKSLGGGQDLLQAPGITMQTRAGTAVGIQGVSVPAFVANNAQLTAVNPAVCNRAILINGSDTSPYIYSETATSGIASMYGGFWVKEVDSTYFDKMYSFESGNTLTTTTQALLYEADGNFYVWGGALPKVVSVNATPLTSGGIGDALWTSVGRGSISSILKSPARTLGDAVIAVKQPFAGALARTQHDKNKDYPSILDWASDSSTDDTTRFTKAIADGIQYLDLPQGSLKVSELSINAAIKLNGVGKSGLNGIGTQIIVDPSAAFGIHFNGAAAPSRPTGGGLFNTSLKCAAANTGDPDLLKVTTWSYFGLDNVELQNTQGWGIRLKDVAESHFYRFVLRAIGGDSTGGILFDDYITAPTANVNNVHFDDGTFAGISGPWVGSTAQSNPDMIWLSDLKVEYDGIFSQANASSKYALDFLNMARCWIKFCGFTFFNPGNNLYEGVLHMGPLCSYSTHFLHNQFFGTKQGWNVEGGSITAKGNTANQATFATPITNVITSSRACDVEPIINVTSNANVTRGKEVKEPGFVVAHDLGGNINNNFTADAAATSSTVMSVPAATQIRQVVLPSNLLDGKSVVELLIRVRCTDTAGAAGSVGVFLGATSLATRTVVAADGWQLLKVQLKPTLLTSPATTLTLTNVGAVSILFDGVKVSKSNSLDWNFSFVPGSVAAGATITSPPQSQSDTVGLSGVIQSWSAAKFDQASTGLIVTVNTSDTAGSFTVSLYNPTGSAIANSITRCFVRLFLN